LYYFPAIEKKPQVHEAADDAEWRSNRLTTQQFLERQMMEGRRISPIFKVFGVFTYLFRVDWLHAVDQGVGADLLGNLLCMIMPKMPGSTIDEKVANIWKECQVYYDTWQIEDRIKDLHGKDFRGNKTNPPKMKGSAAQIRALIQFGKEMANKYLDDTVPREMAAKTAAHHLKNCYQALAESSEACRDEAFQASAKAFAFQYHALWVSFGKGRHWRPKPKMHLFLELCSQLGVRPNFFWCYRDEDFGGSVSRGSKMKGMWKNLSAYTKHGLDMFCMKNPAPRIVQSTM